MEKSWNSVVLFCLEQVHIWQLGGVSNIIENKLGALLPSGKNFVDDYQGIASILKDWCSEGALAPEILPIGLGVSHQTYQRQYNCIPEKGRDGLVGTQLADIFEKYNGQVPPYMGG